MVAAMCCEAEKSAFGLQSKTGTAFLRFFPFFCYSTCFVLTNHIPLAISAYSTQLIRLDDLCMDQVPEIPPAEHLTSEKIAGCQHGLVISHYFVVMNTFMRLVIGTAGAYYIFSDCELYTGSFLKSLDHCGHILDKFRRVSFAFKKDGTKSVMRTELIF
jgi:hypothetical protein